MHLTSENPKDIIKWLKAKELPEGEGLLTVTIEWIKLYKTLDGDEFADEHFGSLATGFALGMKIDHLIALRWASSIRYCSNFG